MGRNPRWIKPPPTKSLGPNPPRRHPWRWFGRCSSLADILSFLGIVSCFPQPSPSSVARSFSAASRNFPAGYINTRAAGGGGGPGRPCRFPSSPATTVAASRFQELSSRQVRGFSPPTRSRLVQFIPEFSMKICGSLQPRSAACSAVSWNFVWRAA
jgi:hypothetical protein